uniref:RNase H type-1 domain-containing protein n=1 Tax=Populus trichocarpa TaxID=3694 RepID=U5G8Y4_POPTR
MTEGVEIVVLYLSALYAAVTNPQNGGGFLDAALGISRPWGVSKKGKPGVAGIGGVLRDCNGKVICLFSIPIGIKDSNEAEFIAVVKAVELTFSREDMFGRSVMVESVSANMVHWVLTPPGNRLWYYQELFILAS